MHLDRYTYDASTAKWNSRPGWTIVTILEYIFGFTRLEHVREALLPVTMQHYRTCLQRYRAAARNRRMTLSSDSYFHGEYVDILREVHARTHTPVCMAVRRMCFKTDSAGKFDRLKALLEEGGDPNEVGVSGFTPLGVLVRIFSVETNVPMALKTLRLLLRHGADASYLFPGHAATLLLDAYTHLDVSGTNGVCRALIKGGANLDTGFVSTGVTPLILAAQKNHLCVLNLLLVHGADPNAPDNQGGTAFAWACYKGHHLIVARLLKCPEVNIYSTNAMSETPLLEAAKHRHGHICELLLSSGYEAIDIPDLCERTALMWACRNNDTRTCRLLLAYGADVLARDDRNNTCLHEAAMGRCSRKLVALLLERDASLLHLVNKKQQTPLGTSIAHMSVNACKVLLGAGARAEDHHLRELVGAKSSGNAMPNRARLCKLLLRTGLDANQIRHSKTILDVAIGRDVATCQTLLHSGARCAYVPPSFMASRWIRETEAVTGRLLPWADRSLQAHQAFYAFIWCVQQCDPVLPTVVLSLIRTCLLPDWNGMMAVVAFVRHMRRCADQMGREREWWESNLRMRDALTRIMS